MSEIGELSAIAAELEHSQLDFYWLDAGPTARSGRSYLVLGTGETLRYDVARGTIEHRTAHDVREVSSTVLPYLRQLWRPTSNVSSTHARFVGGWLGWFGYECAADTLEIPLRHFSSLPDSHWMRAGAWIELDHENETVAWGGAGAPRRKLEEIAQRVSAPAIATTMSDTALSTTWRDDESRYRESITRAQEFIRAGESYQLCLTTQASGSDPVDVWNAYLLLRAETPSHHGCFVRSGDIAIASVSPEQFLDISPAGRIRTKPIKGTRARSVDPRQDAESASELRENIKERAENIMIVDLMRNDLGRVAETGSVRVPELLAVESYAPVHQLVSTVEAQLESGRHPIDVIEATFPAGSMTGAPKHRAVTLLQLLESGARGIYSGAIGYLSDDGSVDLAMVIRTIVAGPTEWTVGAGGGITALSQAESELEEVTLKAQALLHALARSQVKLGR